MQSEKGNRDIVKVLTKIILEVPESEIILLYELMEFYDSLWNKSPETRRNSETWIPLQNILNNNIQIIDKKWKKNIVQIFNEIYTE